jgi:hypothetical protein
MLRATRDGNGSAAEAIARLSRSPHWVWTAIDPESKMLLSVQVGAHPQAMDHAVLHQIAQLLTPGCVPLFLSAGNPYSLPTIVAYCGRWVPSRHSSPNQKWAQ